MILPEHGMISKDTRMAAPHLKHELNVVAVLRVGDVGDAALHHMVAVAVEDIGNHLALQLGRHDNPGLNGGHVLHRSIKLQSPLLDTVWLGHSSALLQEAQDTVLKVAKHQISVHKHYFATRHLYAVIRQKKSAEQGSC